MIPKNRFKSLSDDHDDHKNSICHSRLETTTSNEQCKIFPLSIGHVQLLIIIHVNFGSDRPLYQ